MCYNIVCIDCTCHVECIYECINYTHVLLECNEYELSIIVLYFILIIK